MTDKDLKWLRFCMAGAEIFSTCSKKQYFAVILDNRGRVAGTGWNGAPPRMKHCTQGGCPHATNNEPTGVHDTCVAIHAEENALLYSDRQLREGGTLYVNATPCWGCAKKLAGAGLAKVVCLDDKREDWPRAHEFLLRGSVRVQVVSMSQLGRIG